ncbi:MAG: endonuclease/exonuclease/phosphatase family protein, partial [Lentisphaeria bacterium]|nr:endonuclease/exonuclease/phosphatase family protein [Lentisphaeria bacterium]
EIIKKAAPDFAGLQEVDMYRLLTPLLAPYKFIKEPQNMCAILYDSTKYRELEAGTIPFHEKISHRIRCLNWALFEALDSKKKIIVTNTHWDLTDKTRAINSEKMVLYITELQKKFPGVPIVCTGDFNTFTKKLPLQNFMQKTGLKDAIETAPAVENKRVCSYFYPFCQKKPPTPSYHIDHIIATDDLRPLSASLICGGIVYEASDHLPVIADFVWE